MRFALSTRRNEQATGRREGDTPRYSFFSLPPLRKPPANKKKRDSWLMIERETRDGLLRIRLAIPYRLSLSLALALCVDFVCFLFFFFFFFLSLSTEKKTSAFPFLLLPFIFFFLSFLVLSLSANPTGSRRLLLLFAAALCLAASEANQREQRSSRIRIPCLLQLKNRELEDAGCYMSPSFWSSVSRDTNTKPSLFFFSSLFSLLRCHLVYQYLYFRQRGKSRQIQAKELVISL